MTNNEEFYNEMLSIQYLCNIASKYTLLSPEDELRLLHLTRSEDLKEVKTAYDELIRRNLRLVIKKAKEFMGRGLPLEDLCQEGVTGLIRAIEKFDFTKGVKLSTYATRWIEQRVRRALENKSRLVKIPLNRLAQITALKKAYKKYTEDENRPPTSEEIAMILGISEEEARELGRMVYAHVSLDDAAGEEDNLSMINYIQDHSISPEEKTENLADKVVATHLMSFLSKEDKDFIQLKYGFLDNKERSNREMAQYYKCTSKDIKAREENILNTLREIGDIESINYDP